jgi:hypothetical protein
MALGIDLNRDGPTINDITEGDAIPTEPPPELPDPDGLLANGNDIHST